MSPLEARHRRLLPATRTTTGRGTRRSLVALTDGGYCRIRLRTRKPALNIDSESRGEPVLRWQTIRNTHESDILLSSGVGGIGLP